MMLYFTPYDVTLLMLQSEHVSGAGAERKMERSGPKASERERSGERDFRKKRGAERSGRSGNGNGAVSGSPKNWWSVERHFSPLPLRSHALVAVREKSRTIPAMPS
jgi:hypothetical protein